MSLVSQSKTMMFHDRSIDFIQIEKTLQDLVQNSTPQSFIGVLQSFTFPTDMPEKEIFSINEKLSSIYHRLTLPILGGDTSKGPILAMTWILYYQSANV